ncbi:hypothetical protein PMIN06_007666 [Paraphaeosphaeria minitans]
MATIVDRTPEGIFYRAAKTYPVPDLDLLTLLFDSEHSSAHEDTPIHISAADPSLQLTVSRCRALTNSLPLPCANTSTSVPAGRERTSSL